MTMSRCRTATACVHEVAQMQKKLAAAMIVMLLTGCSQHDKHELIIDRLNKDVGRLTLEKVTLEVRLEASERAQRAMLDEISSLRQQLHNAERRQSAAPLPPSPSSPAPLPHSAVTLAGVSRPGGFTDWGK